ncbi:hypothetical protein [Chitinophaga filiformis]|uniref:Uncharacterized protein n=1 Tax=Chitinophaga filiformis TaxID=104663 RepID=A0ABY4I0W1_CHIFI|nr:hypothetical protein [Chitinophaga filiformis]UPK69725.1 hypothetical protein MYF79_00290 [Chitinophaga filiformis]
MNKAKIMLSGVALLAVVGGALAFKASRLPSNAITSYTTTTAVGGPTVTRCKTTKGFFTTTEGIAANTYTTYNTLNGVCGPVVATFTLPSND